MQHEYFVGVLYSNRYMIDETQVKSFYVALNRLDNQTDAELTNRLLMVFNDSCSHKGGMMSLTHYVEKFEDYVEKLVDFSPSMYLEAKNQLVLLYNRILNSDKSQADLISALNSTRPTNQEIVKEILALVIDRNPSQENTVITILSNLK